MITVNAVPALTIEGVARHECEDLVEYDPIRQAEIISIRRFLEARSALFGGRILDFGAGKPGTCRKPQPYRDLMPAGVDYQPYDRGDELPAGPFDLILCTQVLQFIPDPGALLVDFRRWLRPSGILILTYPTNWDEVEGEDLWRFTKAGVGRMLEQAGFVVLDHTRRAEVRIEAYCFPLGYGVVAVAR